MSPIKPENRARYPKNWKDIRQQILARAALQCERCKANQYQAHPVTGSKVVLTIAHLDHQPENNDPANLAALCQRCHLAYDQEHHMRNASATRARKPGQLDMFEPTPAPGGER